MSSQRYPLDWPSWQPRRPSHKREVARYGQKNSSSGSIQRLTIAQAMIRLMAEIRVWGRRIDGAAVVVSTNLVLNRDGSPRSNQSEPDDPASAVYLVLDGESLCIPSDKWTRAADNIAAIARWLGTQRAAERTGAGLTRATFRGYAVLPPATDQVWYEFLGFSQMPGNIDDVKRAYRDLAASYHPDRSGGNLNDRWLKLQECYAQGLEELETQAIQI